MLVRIGSKGFHCSEEPGEVDLGKKNESVFAGASMEGSACLQFGVSDRNKDAFPPPSAFDPSYWCQEEPFP